MSLVITAAEASGDALGAEVIRGLAQGRVEPVVGIVGPRMRAAAEATGTALEPAGDTRDLGAAGLVEILPALPRLLRARRVLARLLADRTGPALLIDGPDLHLPVARRAPRSPGRPIGLLVAPQYWAWRPERADRLRDAVDFVLCLFRHEVDHLRRLGVMAHWVGHPALDRLQGPRVAPPVLTIAVLPGSRRSEIARLLRPAIASVRRVLGCREHRVVVPWRPPGPPPVVAGVEFSRDPGHQILQGASVAVVAAGTATLEAALAGVPTVIVARAHPATAAMARRMLRVPWVGLPNLTLGREAVPEVVQDLSGLDAAVRSCVLAADRGGLSARGVAEELRAHLGPPGFAARAARVLNAARGRG